MHHIMHYIFPVSLASWNTPEGSVALHLDGLQHDVRLAAGAHRQPLRQGPKDCPPLCRCLGAHATIFPCLIVPIYGRDTTGPLVVSCSSYKHVRQVLRYPSARLAREV